MTSKGSYVYDGCHHYLDNDDRGGNYQLDNNDQGVGIIWGYLLNVTPAWRNRKWQPHSNAHVNICPERGTGDTP